MNCFVCDAPATRRVIVSKIDGVALRYVCCDECEPRHIPQGEIVVIKTEPLTV